MIIVYADIGELNCRILFELWPDLHHNIIWVSQVSEDDPAFEVNRCQQVCIILLTAEGRCDLLLVVVDYLRLGLLFVTKSDLPQFDRLVSRCRD